ncbi:ATP phosphoribosyltransferase [Bienertia sinuspersici]
MWITIPEDLLLEGLGDPIDLAVAEVYPNFLQRYTDLLYLQQRAILAPKNEMVDKINVHILSMIPGEETVYKSADRVCPLTKNGINVEALYPPEILTPMSFQSSEIMRYT